MTVPGMEALTLAEHEGTRIRNNTSPTRERVVRLRNAELAARAPVWMNDEVVREVRPELSPALAGSNRVGKKHPLGFEKGPGGPGPKGL